MELPVTLTTLPPAVVSILPPGLVPTERGVAITLGKATAFWHS